MLQVIDEEMVVLTIPKRLAPKVLYIMTSGVLNLKANSGVLHFDHDNNLRLIEWTNKVMPPNLTT